MTQNTQQSCHDVVIVDVWKKNNDSRSQGRNSILQIAITILATLFLLTIGYLICLKTGIISHPENTCCFGVLDLNFEFDLNPPSNDADT